ncbi:MAG TPA: hypothetical protein VNL17_13445 [Verrucomicrobiae bacterium]|nr:hypothetical protein [Verrucomicrobiae bacterium]
MQNIEIELPPSANLSKAEKTIEATLAAVGLQASPRETLKKFPGCIHWHAKIPGQSGTLELTLWPQQHRAWISIQDGRAADWINKKLPELQKVLDRRLAR